nr:hypothetical protein [uncultured Carboxylicivirga sp.]
MPKPIRYLILTLTVFAFVSQASAQRRRRSTLWDGVHLTPRAGINMFYGDLVDQSRTSYSFGGAAEKELLPYLSARIQLMGGNMKGEQFSGDTDLLYAYFENYYTDFMVGLKFKPLDLALGYFKQRSFSPYMIGQFGLVYYNTKTWYGPAGFDPNTLRHHISGIAPAVSGGLGLSYWVNSVISVNAEYTATLPFSDMVDGHKEWYSGTPGNITTVHQTDASDFYYTATVGVSFLLKDSKWKNEPKYNRKAYLKTRREMSTSSRKNLKSINKRRKSLRRR